MVSKLKTHGQHPDNVSLQSRGRVILMSENKLLNGNTINTGLLNGEHLPQKDSAETPDNCNGIWKGAAIRVFNVVCRCHWLCTSKHGELWSGYWYGLPATNGVIVNTGDNAKRGDSCLCKDPAGGGHIIPLK